VSELESLANKRFGDLLPAEIQLLSNVNLGELTVCGPNDNQQDPLNNPENAEKWGRDRSIRGDVIAWLCADRRAKALVSPGGIQLFGAKIITPVHLLSVQIEFPLAFACCKFYSEINLQSARTCTLSFNQTHLQTILADGAVVAGAFFLRECRAELLQFSGARIEGQFACDVSVLTRLIIDGGVVGVGLFLRRATGQVKMTRARVGMDFDCDGGSFTAAPGSSDPALDAGGVSVEGSVFFRAGFRAIGSVQLLGARIGLNLDCSGAELEILRADSIAVEGTVFLSYGFRAHGAIHFTSCRIRGDFNCTRATIEAGLTIERAAIEGAFFWREVTIAETAGLDLINTSVGSLSDDRASWPRSGHLELHGFVYQRFSVRSPRKADERLDWLAHQKLPAAQSYRQLARTLKDEGDDPGARQVLRELERLRRPWNLASKYIIGYGYEPGWALWWFVGLVFVGFLIFEHGFCAGNMVPTDKDAYACFAVTHSLPDHYERFHALVYSLENSLPLFRLGQIERWQPIPASRTVGAPCGAFTSRLAKWLGSPNFLRWFRFAQLLGGWFLATMWIAGVTGLVRRI
jgi:hypothetical protein